MSDTPSADLPTPEESDNLALNDLFGEYIGAKWIDPVLCPICRTAKWTIQPAIDPPFRYIRHRVLTLIPVSCNNCAYTIFFDGVAAGLFDEKGDPRVAPEKPDAPVEEEADREAVPEGDEQ